MKKLNFSGSIQRKTLIRSTLESLEDVLKHAVIRSGAPLKCLSEKNFEMCFSVVISYAVHQGISFTRTIYRFIVYWQASIL